MRRILRVSAIAVRVTDVFLLGRRSFRPCERKLVAAFRLTDLVLGLALAAAPIPAPAGRPKKRQCSLCTCAQSKTPGAMADKLLICV